MLILFFYYGALQLPPFRKDLDPDPVFSCGMARPFYNTGDSKEKDTFFKKHSFVSRNMKFSVT